MRKIRSPLRIGLLVIIGVVVARIAPASHNDPNISHFCATPGGNAKWVEDPADCRPNETVVNVGSLTAVSDLQSQIDALEARVDALETLLTCVSRPIPETLLLTGCNLQIVNGTGSTIGVNSLGNVIIGYSPGPPPLGSHNLIVGDGHDVTSHSGIVSGFNNGLHSPRSVVGGGQGNSADAEDSFVAGGRDNTTLGVSSFVGGGQDNMTIGSSSFAGGGEANTASGIASFVGGGNLNNASGFPSFIAGGTSNVASGPNSFIGGGFMNAASGSESFVGAGISNTASGPASFVGGSSGHAAGLGSCGIIFGTVFGIC